MMTAVLTSPGRAGALLLLLAALLPAARAAEAPAVEIVSATFFGSSAADNLQGAAVAPDGTIYLAGNTGAAVANLPGGIQPTVLGAAESVPKCGHGFVAHLSADGRTLLHYLEFAPGVALLTSVQVNGAGVYASGYASCGLEPLLAKVPGLQRQYPLRAELAQAAADRAAGKEDKIANRPGLGREGAPFVVRLTPDLARLEAGTYLEGWQQVWDKKRVTKQGQQMLGGFQEYFWQPTALGVLKSGDLIVAHDGGYFRALTAKDRELAAGDEKLLDRLAFYDVCDYVSRLSPDLSQRAWMKKIYTPSVDPEVAKTVRQGWPLPHLSNPRTHDLQLDGADNIYVGGWSASQTSQEPWWSPFLWKLEPDKGEPVWKAYDYDPLSGGGHRMSGEVSDTAVTALALDRNGHVFSGLLADGGNTVMERSPAGKGAPFGTPAQGAPFGVKLVHWWGQVHRFDSHSMAGLARARIGPWGWATGLLGLADDRVLALGRYNWHFDFTEDAWSRETLENPNAFLRLYSADFKLRFSSSLPGIVPFQIVRLGERRAIVVGRADQPGAPVREALWPTPLGQSDGYFLLLEVRQP